MVDTPRKKTTQSNEELLRLVEAIHRDKNIEKEVIFLGIESALTSAVKKRLRTKTSNPVVTINRVTGEILAFDGEESIDPAELGRIAAQSAKQVMLQRIREAEQEVLFREYSERRLEMVSGTVIRIERGDLIIDLSRVEGILPRSEQIPGDTYRMGDHVRSLLYDVRRFGQRVRAVLSRSHPDFVKRLFELEVPEVREEVVVVRAVAREAGKRTKIAVESRDPRIDPVGACVGVRGSRIKNIVEELDGEKIDIIPWDDEPIELIANALKPAEVHSITIDVESQRATVAVLPESISLALGRRGQNVRLASKLAGWSIDIVPLEGALTPAEQTEGERSPSCEVTPTSSTPREIDAPKCDGPTPAEAESLPVEGLSFERTELPSLPSDSHQPATGPSSPTPGSHVENDLAKPAPLAAPETADDAAPTSPDTLVDEIESDPAERIECPAAEEQEPHFTEEVGEPTAETEPDTPPESTYSAYAIPHVATAIEDFSPRQESILSPGSTGRKLGKSSIGEEPRATDLWRGITPVESPTGECVRPLSGEDARIRESEPESGPP